MTDPLKSDAWSNDLPPEVLTELHWPAECDMRAFRIPLYIDGQSGDPELEAYMAYIFAETFELWKRKQHDYGPANIAMAGEIGVAGRANDKLQRLRNLNGHEARNEPIEDAWLDLCDYGAIGLCLHRGWWPMENAFSSNGHGPTFVITDDGLTVKRPDGTEEDVTLSPEELEALDTLMAAARDVA